MAGVMRVRASASVVAAKVEVTSLFPLLVSACFVEITAMSSCRERGPPPGPLAHTTQTPLYQKWPCPRSRDTRGDGEGPFIADAMPRDERCEEQIRTLHSRSPLRWLSNDSFRSLTARRQPAPSSLVKKLDAFCLQLVLFGFPIHQVPSSDPPTPTRGC